MRLHFNLKKIVPIIEVIEKAMQASGLHVHGLSGDELATITHHAITTGSTITDAVKQLGLEVKAAATAPEVP